MDFKEYQKLAVRTAKTGDDNFNLVHGALGVASEAGEFALTLEAAAERFYTVSQRVMISTPLTATQQSLISELVANLREEIGDGLWYNAYLAESFHFPMYNSHVLPETRNFLPASGLAITAGEIVDIAKRLFVYEKPMDAKALTKLVQRNTAYWIQAIEWLGAEVGDVLQENIDKLKARYPEAYSNEAALARADKDGEAA